jgi:hypothetical protein
LLAALLLLLVVGYLPENPYIVRIASENNHFLAKAVGAVAFATFVIALMLLLL